MNKNKLREELTILFWIFIIGSIAGFIFEITVVFFQKGHFELRQGLIYGPFIPVYGIGAILYYVVLNKIKLKNKLQIFLITMLLGGLTEYLCSFMQEKLFGTRYLGIIHIYHLIFKVEQVCYIAFIGE